MHIRFGFAALFAAFAASTEPALAQENSTRPTFQLRAGAMLFTPLVQQNVREVRDSSLGPMHAIKAQQQPAPVISAAVFYPLRTGVIAELSGSYARSTLRGEDDLGEWTAADLSVINVVIGARYQRWSAVSIDGGVGITKLAGSSTGMFAKGNGLRPLFEAGITANVPAPLPLQVVARAQTHTFITGTLQDDGAEQGQVWRGVLQLGTTFGRKR